MKVFEIRLPEFSEWSEDSIEAHTLDDAVKSIRTQHFAQYETSVIFTSTGAGDSATIRVSLPFGAFVDYEIVGVDD